MVAAVGERRLPPETFRLLRDLIYDYCGIFFSDDNAYIVHRRLQPRLEALALVDFAEYYRYLRSCDPQRASSSWKRSSIASPPTRPTSSAKATSSPRSATRSCRALRQASARQTPQRLVGRLRLGRRGLHHRHPHPGDGALRRLGRARLRQRHLAPLPETAAAAPTAATRSAPPTTNCVRRYFREVDGEQQVRDEVRALVSFGQINLMDER